MRIRPKSKMAIMLILKRYMASKRVDIRKCKVAPIMKSTDNIKDERGARISVISHGNLNYGLTK